MSWTIDKIKSLDPDAFKNTSSIFYSCNAATEINGTTFAKEWNNITGGKTKAAKGFTWYGDINSFSVWFADSWLTHKSMRNLAGGYSVPYPAFRRPTLAEGAEWKTYN